MGKLLFFFLSLAIISCGKTSRQRVSLTIKLNGFNDTCCIYLDELRGAYVPFDTAKSNEEGLFEFTNEVVRTSFFRLRLPNGQTMPMILVPDQHTAIETDADSLCRTPTITNNAETQGMMRSMQIAAAYLADLRQLAMVFDDSTRAKPDLKEKDSLVAMADTFLMAHKKALRSLVDEHAELLSAMPILLQKAGNHSFFSPIADQQLFTDIDNALIRKYGNLSQVKRFHYRLDSAFANIDSLQGVRIGETMRDPEGKTIWGEELPLRKLKGKPVLVFVWSSYDDASEANVPIVKELWETYHKRGLDVYMISVDSTETLWRNAIDQHRLACFHVNDLMGSRSNVFKDMGVRSLPANFLLDREGIIVEKNIWGSPLENAILKQIGK